jgi:hypothetical protein
MEKREQHSIQRIQQDDKVPSAFKNHVENKMLMDLGFEYAKKYANKQEVFVYEKLRILSNGGDIVQVDKRDDSAMLKKHYKYMHTIVKYTLD